MPASPLHVAGTGCRKLLLLIENGRQWSHTVTSNMWLPTVRGISELADGLECTSWWKQWNTCTHSAALSRRVPGGAKKPVILWPWRLLSGALSALQTNTRSCSMSCLLQDMTRVTAAVYLFSNLKERKKERPTLAFFSLALISNAMQMYFFITTREQPSSFINHCSLFQHTELFVKATI